MFDSRSVLRHLAQNQLLNRKRRNEKHGERVEIDRLLAACSAPSEPGVRSDSRPSPSTGDLVLLWTVSNLTNKPGM